MHVAINAWFWDRPDTGSGQYTRHLVGALLVLGVRVTLVAPKGRILDPPPGANILLTRSTQGRNLGKVFFEQVDFPHAAQTAGADLAHVPYWGGPLRSPVPTVVTIHDLVPLLLSAYRGGPLVRLYTSLVAASARGAAAVLTDSQASRQDILTHLGFPPEQVYAIPLAVDDAYTPHPNSGMDTAIHQKYGLPTSYVLYLGGYDVRKNLRILLQAYAYVRNGVGDEYPLVLAGRLPTRASPHFPPIKPLCQELHLEDAIYLIGPVDEADKPALYRTAACFVYPSRYEGFGLPPLEAMACGAPVVAANTSSLPEVIGEAGFLVSPDDARGMAGAIIAILLQEELAQTLRQRGLAQAARFSWDRTARETISVYEHCNCLR